MPRPLPTALKIMRGEKRPSRLNQREPQAPAGAGPPPAHLTPEARALWEEIVPTLEAARILTVLDAVALEVLVDSILDYRKSRTDDKRAAFAAGTGKRLLRVLAEFGLTPSARSRILAVPPADGDGFAEFLRAKPTR